MTDAMNSLRSNRNSRFYESATSRWDDEIMKLANLCFFFRQKSTTRKWGFLIFQCGMYHHRMNIAGPRSIPLPISSPIMHGLSNGMYTARGIGLPRTEFPVSMIHECGEQRKDEPKAGSVPSDQNQSGGANGPPLLAFDEGRERFSSRRRITLARLDQTDIRGAFSSARPGFP
jgi:hypothetical protein